MRPEASVFDSLTFFRWSKLLPGHRTLPQSQKSVINFCRYNAETGNCPRRFGTLLATTPAGVIDWLVAIFDCGTGRSTNSSVSVWIGSDPIDATHMPWDGQIDKVKIYERALSTSKIADAFAGN